MEEWREIPRFPGYSVSNLGRVRNDETGRFMTPLRNSRKTVSVSVGLTKNFIQHKRAVSLLVANAFLPPPPNEAFDTTINLDGDRTNNEVGNLVWRPRWFAIKYFLQFRNPQMRGFYTPVEEVTTGEIFETSWFAAIKFGLIDTDIFIATMNGLCVWPTQQWFRQVL